MPCILFKSTIYREIDLAKYKLFKSSLINVQVIEKLISIIEKDYIMTKSTVLTHNLGFPRIGDFRELKIAIEAYWNKKISLEELEKIGKTIRRKNWEYQSSLGIDIIPSNDFSMYDTVLDTSLLFGVIPERFQDSVKEKSHTERAFLLARGEQAKGHFASEMTKWFNTNYHYIVPELSKKTVFSLASTKIFDEFSDALDLGIKTVPILLGPLTFLRLSKYSDPHSKKECFEQHLTELTKVYLEVFEKLEVLGADSIQIDEPILALDLNKEEREAFASVYQTFSKSKLKKLLNYYFGDLRENIDLVQSLPVEGLHIDLTASDTAEAIKLASHKQDLELLSIGIIDGRNIWKTSFDQALGTLKDIELAFKGIIAVSPSCSLLHVPVTLESETSIDPEIEQWLCFAKEKLQELVTLSDVLNGKASNEDLSANQNALKSRQSSKRIHRPNVKNRVASITEKDSQRLSPFDSRIKQQNDVFAFPLFPTTTIGSFPQTAEVRQARRKFKEGGLNKESYEKFLKDQIESCVRYQEELNMDLLVHGEFERNDMVEYFGEKLEGFLFTNYGWVQSYGTRCVKPPIIYGDVERIGPMTIEWSAYTQSLTKKPVKGMLTGPVTILMWSFKRDDISYEESTKQIALALRDECVDLEKAGILAIQIDEPALREGLPLRKSDWKHYLDWATESFRLSASGVKDTTQIHTHMCYSEFNDIIESIAELDADVISIETCRSQMELLDAFSDYKYTRHIGPGIYDIHSPRIPNVEEMLKLMEKACNVLPKNILWINPDCGLKTRKWEDVKPALKAMMEVALKLREKYNT